MTRWTDHIVLFGLAATLAACIGLPPQTYRFTRFSMGTVVEYTVVSATHTRARSAVDAAHAEIERIADLFGEDDSSSAIHRINQSGEALTVAREVAEFLDRTHRYSERTGGAFDVTVKPLLGLYGFDAADPTVPSNIRIVERLRLVGHEGITVEDGIVYKAEPDVSIAVGGVAKGYAVDRAVAVLREHGIDDAVVNAGGDIYCLGTNGGRPWRVGIRHPDREHDVLAVLELSDAAVATSGDYERFFEEDGVRYHHLLDPRTGSPARLLRSATVVAASAEEADAMATGVFVLGRKEGLALARREALQVLVMDASGYVARSRDLPLAGKSL